MHGRRRVRLWRRSVRPETNTLVERLSARSSPQPCDDIRREQAADIINSSARNVFPRRQGHSSH